MARGFDPEVLASAERNLVIGVRAGDAHRFTPVWSVIVDGRVFVRSWGLSGRGWYDAFRADPQGAVEIAERQFDVRALRTEGEDLLDAVDEAYRTKYHTPGSLKYVEDLNSSPRRETTIELVPSSRSR